MKKAILISIRPEWVAKILNGEKTIEIRKTAPKCELPIDVYIYCTKNGKRPINLPWEFLVYEEKDGFVTDCDFKKGNGKVVAKFTMKNCVHLEHDFKEYDLRTQEVILESSCLKNEEIENYAGGKGFFYWEISELQIFDQPKELSDFGLKRAPQSWQYVEVVG